MADVKTCDAVMRDGATPNTMGAPPPTPSPRGETATDAACHAQWVNGIIIIIQTGMSPALAPNTRVVAVQGGIPVTSTPPEETINPPTWRALGIRADAY